MMETPVAVAGWPDQAETFYALINSYRSKDMFCDCTLACDRKFFRAHKMVLSMCSEFFENIFSNAQDKNPVIILNEVESWQLECLLNYMYRGETSVPETLFSSLCRVARCLQIKGFDMVEYHRKAVKQSKHKLSQNLDWSLEESKYPYTDRYPPEKNSKSMKFESRDVKKSDYENLNRNQEYESRNINKDFECQNRKVEIDSLNRRSTFDAHKNSSPLAYDLQNYDENSKSLTPNRPTPPRSSDSQRSAFSKYRKESNQDYLIDTVEIPDSNNYRTKYSPLIQKKLNNSEFYSQDNHPKSQSTWVKSEEDFPTYSSAKMKTGLSKTPPPLHDVDHPYPQSEKRSESFDGLRLFKEKDNKENETLSCSGTRRLPPDLLLPSKLVDVRKMECVSPSQLQRSSPSENDLENSSNQEISGTTSAHQRGPPPLLKMINESSMGNDNVHTIEDIKESFTKYNRLSDFSSIKPVRLQKLMPYLQPAFPGFQKNMSENMVKVSPKFKEMDPARISSPESNDSETPLNLTSDYLSIEPPLTKFTGDNEDPLLKKIQTNKRKRVRGPKSWEFLLRLLRDRVSNPSLIKWEDEANGIFRLIKPEIIAQRWGRRTGKHGNDTLSYESFARGLRYHYASGALTAVSEKSFVYQFGPKAQKSLRGVDRIDKEGTVDYTSS